MANEILYHESYKSYWVCAMRYESGAFIMSVEDENSEVEGLVGFSDSDGDVLIKMQQQAKAAIEAAQAESEE